MSCHTHNFSCLCPSFPVFFFSLSLSLSLYVHMYTYIHTHIHIYIYIYIYMIYIYIYIFFLLSLSLSLSSALPSLYLKFFPSHTLSIFSPRFFIMDVIVSIWLSLFQVCFIFFSFFPLSLVRFVPIILTNCFMFFPLSQLFPFVSGFFFPLPLPSSASFHLFLSFPSLVFAVFLF